MKGDCVHCNPTSRALAHKLMANEDFLVVGDAHPLKEGHILVIPRCHLPCIGSLPDDLFLGFKQLYEQVSRFLVAEYGPILAFEHGVFGQTVSHAHVHFLPYFGKAKDVIADFNALYPIVDIRDIQMAYRYAGGYLFIEIEKQMYLLDGKCRRPRILRDLVATALGVGDRSDWVVAQSNQQLMLNFDRDTSRLKTKWAGWFIRVTESVIGDAEV